MFLCHKSSGLFYVSYFSTLAILLVITIMFFRIFYVGQSDDSDTGHILDVFQRYTCVSYEGNYENSLKTFISTDGLMFGIINTIGNFGTVFLGIIIF